MNQPPWLQDIPRHWAIRPLWTEFRRGKSLGDGTEELLSVYREFGVIPKSSRDDNFNKPSEDLSKYQRVSVGDLVVNKMKAWQGSLGVSGFEGIVSPAYFVYTATGSIERGFAHYLLRSKGYADHMGAISYGIRPNQWDLDPHQFSVTPLLIPPPSEQRSIVEYLDRETAQIDALIAKNEELIALLAERRNASVTHALTGDWLTVQLRALSTVPIQNGVDAVGDPANPQEWPRYVRTTDIESVNSLDPEKRVTIAPEAAAGALVSRDDLVLTRAGATIGKSYLHASDDRASYAGYLVRVRPDKRKVLPWYLAFWTQSQHYLDQVRAGAVVSTIENFSASKYRALRVPLPPLEEQARVVARIGGEIEASERAVRLAESAIGLARERRAALISAAVTGKIDVVEVA